MGLLDMLKNLNNAEGIREAMRMSYDKHLKKAYSGAISAPDTTPAQSALYGALGTRYLARGQVVPEVQLWKELIPFLALRDSDARESLAEYVVYCEKPAEARVDVLRAKINEGLRRANKEVRIMAFTAMQQGVAWTRLLEEQVRALLESSLEYAE